MLNHRTIGTLLLILIALLGGSILFGAAVAIKEPVLIPVIEPTWYKHPDVLTSIIVALLAIVTFFSIRTLKKIDLNQGKLFKQLDDLARDFYVLRGEHNVIASRCGIARREGSERTRKTDGP